MALWRIALVSIKWIIREVEREIAWVMSISLENAVENGLMELKAYGWTEQRNLSYTQLEYIQSSWTQYIDTGIKLNQNNTVEVKYCYHVESSTLTSGRIFWARYTSAPRKSFSIGSNTGKASASTVVFGQFGDNNVNALNNIVIGQRDTYKLSADGFYVNDIKQGDFPTATFETPFTVKLFAFEQATSSSGTASIGCGVWRCKEFKVLNGDTLVMDLIPARNTSNVIGMYDLVSGQFFANAGTGTFTAWPDVVPTPTAPIDIVSNNGAIKIRRQSGLPINYQMVEWIKPTGSIAITDFKTKSTQEITTVLYREAAGAGYLYASDTATSGTTNTTAYLTSWSGNWRWDGKYTSISVPYRTEITSVQSADGVYINDTQYPYATPGEFVSTNDLRLSSNENTTIRIYSMTIREGETVTLDLVPVQKLSDSTYGFYDKVSGNFYTNSEATFVAGDVISDPVEMYTDWTTETIEDELWNTATAEMLLKVWDYADEQEILTWNVTRNVGIKVLDWTENWTQISGSSAPFALVVDDFKSAGLGTKVLVSSTHLQGVTANSTWSNYNNLISFTTGTTEQKTFRVRYLANTKTLAEFKQFLAEQYANGTPVICVYYKTPTTESVAGQTMHIPAWNSTIEITQASIDTLELSAKYKALP